MDHASDRNLVSAHTSRQDRNFTETLLQYTRYGSSGRWNILLKVPQRESLRRWLVCRRAEGGVQRIRSPGLETSRGK